MQKPDYRVSNSQLKFWLDERKTSIAAEKTRILDHRSEGKKEDYFYVFARSIARCCMIGFAEAGSPCGLAVVVGSPQAACLLLQLARTAYLPAHPSGNSSLLLAKT